MARRQDQSSVLGHLHTLFNVGTIRELSDGQLLERFATGSGEVGELAFAVLVERHGAMVLRVCRSVLADPHDRDDAFQATFLVLVRRASALWVRDSLGPWLHQVAYRTACQARTAAARRRRHERRAAELAPEARPDVEAELEQLLHEELDRLPEHYRAPMVLCDLSGRTHEQAARHLGWAVGTVKSRLARGRERLRDRLRRRGYGPDASVLAAALRGGGSEASVPPALAESATHIAVQSITARTVLSGSAAALATGVLRTMSAIHGLKVASIVLVVAIATTGVPLLAQKAGRGTGARAAAPAADKGAGEVPTVVVRPGKLKGSLVIGGMVQPASVHDVFSSAEGQATILSLVPNRTVVKKGELVCELDSSALNDQLLNQEIATKGAEAAYQNAKLARQVAEIALTEYADGTYKQKQIAVQGEIATAEDDLKTAESRLERTKRARKRLDNVSGAKAGPSTPTEILAELEIDDRLDAAESAVKREKLALERAVNTRTVLERFTRDKVVKELQAEIAKQRSDELTKEQIWELDRTKEKKLRTQIANRKLLAPADGLVVYAMEPARGLGGGAGGFGGGAGGFGGMGGGGGGLRPVQAGETIHERQKVFSIPAGPFAVTIAASKAVADRLAVGNSARVKPNAMPGEVLDGVVEQIKAVNEGPPRFGMLPGARKGFGGPRQSRLSLGNEYFITVKIDKAPLGLGPDQFAQAEIFANERDDVLSVPSGAILHHRDRDRVVVKKPDASVALREVTLGVANEKMAEILQGLESGEAVVLNPTEVEDDALREELLRLDRQGGFQ